MLLEFQKLKYNSEDAERAHPTPADNVRHPYCAVMKAECSDVILIAALPAWRNGGCIIIAAAWSNGLTKNHILPNKQIKRSPDIQLCLTQLYKYGKNVNIFLSVYTN